MTIALLGIPAAGTFRDILQADANGKPPCRNSG